MRFSFPIPNTTRITQSFKEHEEFREANKLKFYNGGIDFGVGLGTPVKAAAAGKVIRADGTDTTGYGNQVRIDHGDGVVTLYAHLSEFRVSPGQEVFEGQVVGLSGFSGNCRPPGPAGAHLHFEARRNDVAFDPYPALVDFSKVRFMGEVLAGLGLAVRDGPGKEFGRTGQAYPTGAVLEIEGVQGDWAKLWPGGGWVCVREEDNLYLKLTPAGEQPRKNEEEKEVVITRTVEERLALLEKQVALLVKHLDDGPAAMPVPDFAKPGGRARKRGQVPQ